jgi:predicted CXXCH cytochrome family protein
VKKRCAIGVLFLLVLSSAWAQLRQDQLGVHDMSPGGSSPVRGGIGSACLYCHAPHGGATSGGPLWNQTLSLQTYSAYTSSTYHQQGTQPLVGSPSKLCLSCHDGSVAPGQTVSFGQLTMSGSMKAASKFGSDLKGSHPFSLRTPLVDSPEMKAALAAFPPQTGDPAVQLVNGSVECTTCHQPHFQSIDKVVQQFLVRESSSGTLCLACHDPTRTVSGQVNYLAGWGLSAHATAANTTSNSPPVGGYATVAQNACSGCHMPHNAYGPARLLRGPDEQDCLSCHNGANTQPLAPNVFAQISKGGHPFPAPNNTHDRIEPALLNNNRHATCVDCHNPHASQTVPAFGIPPGIRASQSSVGGISAGDGTTVLNPAVNQFENCFRCHGSSAGKVADTTKYGYLPVRLVAPADPLNVILQFSASFASSHPVTHDRSSMLAQPSLRAKMLNLDGVTLGRDMGVRLLCTDCHNSDDNREFGGAGASGPHGSKFSHILERRYEMSRGPSPGAVISNLFPNPDLTSNGPYALCGKCHDLSRVLSDTSFSRHSKHVTEVGVSCSVCHTSHGMGATNSTVTGQRLVNFDLNVVAANGTSPIAYSQAARTCTLTCHGSQHSNKTY